MPEPFFLTREKLTPHWAVRSYFPWFQYFKNRDQNMDLFTRKWVYILAA